LNSHDFSYDQQNLATLCADRPLRTAEIHVSNDFYGQASVLKRYARLPQFYSLKGVLEHGIHLGDQLQKHDRDARLPMVFCASTSRAALHRQGTPKRAVPIGFGFLYAKQLVEQTYSLDREPHGTLAFPCHSTHTIRVDFDHPGFARRLATLPPAMQPVTVCLYWKNYLAGEHHVYHRLGLDVVTAGHMFDRDFLLRLYDLCRRFRYATSNAAGSHLFMAVVSGCRFFYTESAPIRWQIPAHEKPNSSRGNPLFESRCRESRQLFAKPVETITRAQKAFVDNLIGTAHRADPRQLRRLFMRAEVADKLGWHGAGGWACATALQRRLAHIKRIRNSIAKRLPSKESATCPTRLSR
jgi:hypothetical protein